MLSILELPTGDRMCDQRRIPIREIEIDPAELRQVVAQKYDVDPEGRAARSEVWFFWINFERKSLAQLSPPTDR